ncbi:hypothetical protein ACVODM_22860, partial [Shigella flexneri]
SREYLLLSGNSSFVSINIDGRDCCQTGQFSQDVADGALTVLMQTLTVLIGSLVMVKAKEPKFGRCQQNMTLTMFMLL